MEVGDKVMPGAALETLSISPDASIVTRVRLALGALKVLANEPANEGQASILNACLDAKRYVSLAETLRATDEGQVLLTQRPSLQGPEVPLAELTAMPEGSVGREFARYFERNGISPFHTTARIDSDFDFIGKRYRETHDLFHVLTGYGTDVIGEMELQAFVRGNLRLPSTLLIVAVGVGVLLKDGIKKMPGYLARIRRAFKRGRRTRQLLSVPYEQYWTTPLSELVAQLQIPKLIP